MERRVLPTREPGWTAGLFPLPWSLTLMVKTFLSVLTLITSTMNAILNVANDQEKSSVPGKTPAIRDSPNFVAGGRATLQQLFFPLAPYDDHSRPQ